MSVLLIICVVIFVLHVISLFGKQMSSENSLKWYLFLLFSLVAAVHPPSLTFVSQLLGITLVSNFVLAVFCVFLILQVIEQTCKISKMESNLRTIVSVQAGLSFKKSGDAPVLIVVPCYNEEEALTSIISRLDKLKSNHQGLFDYCIVDDASRDQSLRLLKRLAPSQYVSHHLNTGVSGVLLTGFHICLEHNYTYAVQCDGDGQHPIEDIPRLYQQAIEKGSDLLVGTRYARNQVQENGPMQSTTRMRRFGTYLISRFLGIVFPNVNSTDPTSGFRIYSAAAMKVLRKEMPEKYPEPESLALAAVNGLKLAEIQVNMEPRRSGVSSISGLSSLRFMTKVITALIGLRIRSWL